MSLHVCDYSKHTRQESKTKPGGIQSDYVREMTAEAVINDFSSCDLQGSILSFPHAHVNPSSFFS